VSVTKTYQTLGELLVRRGQASAGTSAFRVRSGTAYVDLTWKDIEPRLERIAAGLVTIPGGLAHGAPVGIIGNTRLEWVLSDFACLRTGLRTVPIYASLLPEEVGYQHVDIGIEVAICEDKAQVEKCRSLKQGFRFFDRDYASDQVKLRHLVVIDPTGLVPAADWESLEDLEKRGAARLESVRAELEERRGKVQRTDTATWTYTSGTTGPPKAVTQTHDNMLSMLESIEQIELFNTKVREGGLFLFLPLAHSFGRLIELAGPFYDAPIVLSTIPTLVEDLGLSKPGFFPSAPRVFEKMKAKIDGSVAGAPPFRQRMFHWAMGVGRAAIPYKSRNQSLPFFLGLQHGLAERLVFSKLRARLGFDRLEFALTGSAPLGQEVHEFFLAMGVLLLEGYGLTETCPGLSSTRPGKVKVGTIGVPFPNVVLRIAEDGEILAKGANITKGYHNRPDANADAFDADGWFHTGDLGSVDEEGYYRITGRKKELLKTSGGKYIAPVKIESRLKSLVFVQEAVVIGDRRNYCVALFALDTEGLTTWAQQQGVAADPQSEPVRKAVQAHVDEVNKGLASFESIKYFRVLPEPLSVENGVLTASLKVKRKVVDEKYAAQIEEMYQGKDA
jgi:long-chain acyl-CoA synthetase